MAFICNFRIVISSCCWAQPPTTGETSPVITYSDIKVYLTRQEDVDVASEDRTLLAREVGADLYVAVSLNGDAQDREQFGTEVAGPSRPPQARRPR